MAQKKKQPEEAKVPDETAEEIYRKEIEPHQGSTIGPSPTGNVQDSHIPPPRGR
jgi:hypothetical protein